MKRILASSFAAFSFAAAAQAPSAHAGAPPRSDVFRTCPDCGEIRSIRRIEREQRPSNVQPDNAPSGLVASIPFGGGKPTVGSSTREERRREPPIVTYEVIVQLEDGRARIIVQDEEPVGLKIGDRVRVEDNKVRPR
ncbi:MAG: hypothetical protein ACXWGT_10955 [Usitatibacter sp.]